jgi:hypothetical protein
MSDSIYDVLRIQEGQPNDASVPKKMSLITRRGRKGQAGPGDMIPEEGASSLVAPRVVQIKEQ